MEKKKKSIVIGVTGVLLVTLILLGLTYAYYRTRIVGNTNTTSVSAVSKNLSVKYQNESAAINTSGIEPGYSATKTFEVKNTGSETVNYSIMLDNVENTFTRNEDWTYTISESESKLREGKLPTNDSYILYNESISAGATKSYTLKIEYANLTDINQSVDMGKKLAFRINIDNSLGLTLTGASEGTLLYAIGEDNVVATKPLSVPGKNPSGISIYTEGELSTSSSTTTVPSSYQQYFTYGTGYTFNQETGTYALTGVQTTTGTYTNSYNELVGKYVAYNELPPISGSTTEEALNRQTSGLIKIYKITSATANSFSYQTKEASPSYIQESILTTTEDDYGISYYFRGAVENNYVTYSNMCWRIVRVQGDGTIKLVLADENHACGTSNGYSTTNSTSAFINNAANAQYLSTRSNNANDFLFSTSNIKTVLSTWATSASHNLDMTKLVEAEWCNDTAKIETNTNGALYGAYGRLNNISTANPTLKCNTEGMTGTTGIEKDAQKYIGKIALLTADEVAFAGSVYCNGGSCPMHNYYLMTNAYVSNSSYWTMTPFIIASTVNYALVTTVETSLASDVAFVNDEVAIRPAVVLNSNVTISSGNGTVDSPYIVN